MRNCNEVTGCVGVFGDTQVCAPKPVVKAILLDRPWSTIPSQAQLKGIVPLE